MIVLALLIEGEPDIDAEFDGLTGTLPTFTTDYATVAVQCAAALKEADPGAVVTLELRDVDWSAIDALGQAVDGLAVVLRVATAWRMRMAMAAAAVA